VSAIFSGAQGGALAHLRHPNVCRTKLGAEGRGFLCEEPPLGALADFLQPPGGGPPARAPPLTAAERLGVAIGAARGLAFLHGVRAAGEGGAPTLLHMQMAPASLGLFAREQTKLVLGPAFIAQGAESDGGVRYCGAASLAGEVHALGAVLCELLSGRLLGGEGDLRAARAALLGAAGDGGGGGGSGATDAAWVACAPAAVVALARLALRCTDPAPERRPGSAREVALALEALLPAATAPPLSGACGSCAEAYGEAQGLRCAGGHFTCADCLSNQVEMMQGTTTPAELKATSGGLRCLAIVEGAPRGRYARCSELLAQDAVIPLLRPEAVVALLRATTHAYLSTVQREERAVAKAATAKDRVAALCGAWTAAAGGSEARADALAALAAHVADEALNLHCPNCGAIQELTSACPKVSCGVNEDGRFLGGCGFSYTLGQHDGDRGARMARALLPLAPPPLRKDVLGSLAKVLEMHRISESDVMRGVAKAEAERVRLDAAAAAAAAGGGGGSGDDAGTPAITRGDITGNDAMQRDSLDALCAAGSWDAALALLDARPDLVNAAKLPAPLALPMRSFHPSLGVNSGFAPLHFAVASGNQKVAEELCRRGANPHQSRWLHPLREGTELQHTWKPPVRALAAGKGLFVGCKVQTGEIQALPPKLRDTYPQIMQIWQTTNDGSGIGASAPPPSRLSPRATSTPLTHTHRAHAAGWWACLPPYHAIF
jgi:hypothetical protein